MASLILVRNVVGELQPKKTLAASRGFLAVARLSCSDVNTDVNKDAQEVQGIISQDLDLQGQRHKQSQ